MTRDDFEAQVLAALCDLQARQSALETEVRRIADALAQDRLEDALDRKRRLSAVP